MFAVLNDICEITDNCSQEALKMSE